jgi:ribosome-associated toxin RatA of RatAB toxin-antitoxin module
MRSTRLRVALPTTDAGTALARIADFAAFPALAEDVRSVDVRAWDVDGGTSSWVVSFRRGVLSWVERDTVDSAAQRIDFRQVTGDFADFHGSWHVTPGEVLFEVTYDFGIDSMAAILDPIAERVIKRVVRSALSGLFGEVVVLEGGEALSDLGRAA